MKNTTFAWIIGLILIIGVSGYLYSKSRKKNDTTNNPPVVQNQGTPTPNTSRENITFAPPQTTQGNQQDAQNQSTTAKPKQSQKKSGTKVSQKPRVAGATTQPANITYINAGLSVQITIPSWWQIRESDTDANNITFFSGSTTLGTMKVLGLSGDTLSNIRLVLSRNSDIYNVADTTVSGIPAISYNSYSDPGTHIVTVYKNNTYTFSGQAALAPFITLLRFI